MRAFVAVKIEPTPPLDKVLERLGAMGSAVRAADRSGLHVTLKFLGETPDDEIPLIVEAIRESVAGRGPIAATLHGLGAFPRVERPTVVWAGLRGAEALSPIAVDLESFATALGHAADPLKFVPHVTLARIKAAPPSSLHELLRGQADRDFGPAPIASVELFRSDLAPGGPTYTVLESVPLSG